MGKNCIKYLVFMFIVIFSFNFKVNAIPTSQLGEEGTLQAKELSCLYENSIVADKVMLVQDRNGKITIYKHGEDKNWDDYGWYVAEAIPRWGDLKEDVTDGQLKIYDKETGDDEKISGLTSCPTAKITLYEGGVRFYKEDELYYHPESKGGKQICLLEDSKDSAFHPKANYYNNSSVDVSGKSCDSYSKEEMWKVVNSGIYATSCLYAKDVDGGCHIIRLDVDTNKGFHWTEAEPLQNEEINKENKTMSFEAAESANVDSMFVNFSGNCPDFLFVNRNVVRAKGSGPLQAINTKVSFDDSKFWAEYIKYYKYDHMGINQVTGEELTGEVNLTFQKIEILDCDALFGGSTDLVDLLKFILNLIKVLVPLLLIGLGVLDFAKAIFAGSEDNMKKAQAKFIKRVIIAVAIFLVPSILKLILGIASSIWGNIDADLCGLL